MSISRALGKALQRANEALESRQYIRAVIGTPDGLTLDGDRPGYIWAQVKAADSVSVAQIRCDKVLPQMGMEVLCRKNRYDGVLEVVEGAPDVMSEYFDGMGSANVGPHGWAHGLYGPDVDWIESGRFLPLLVHPTYPQSLSVEIEPFYYVYSDSRQYYAGETVDLTAYVPSNSGEQRLIVIDLDPSTGTAAVIAADPVYSAIVPSQGHPFTSSDITAVSLTSGRLQVEALRLYTSQTEIGWLDYVTDLRPHFDIPTATLDASDITYTPAVDTDWDSDTDPGDLDDAVDQLAERVDDLEGGGSSNPLLITITAGENLSADDRIWFDPSDQKWYQVDIDDSTPLIGMIRAIATEAISADATGIAQIGGIYDGFSGLTPGGWVWASTTAGGYTQTKPSPAIGGSQVVIDRIGRALSSTDVLLSYSPLVFAKRDTVAVDGTLTLPHISDEEHVYTRRVFAQVKTKNYTADQCSGGTPTASSEYSGSYPVTNVFDGTTSTEWISDAGGLPQWVEYEFASAKAIRAVKVYAHATLTQAPGSFNIQYWDGDSWENASSETGIVWAIAGWKTFYIDADYSSTKWRIYVTSTPDGTYARMGEMEMLEIDYVQSEDCTIGRYSGGTRDIGETVGDGSGNNLDTQTTIINKIGAAKDLVVGVEFT